MNPSSLVAWTGGGGFFIFLFNKNALCTATRSKQESRIAMKDKINGILSEAEIKIAAAANEGELQNVKSAFTGKQ